MANNPFVIVIMAVAILNGIFSPFVVVTAQVMISAILPPLLLAGPAVVIFIASLIGATATIMLAGVPAALFERATGRTESDSASFAIWLVSAVVISFPAILTAVSVLS